MKKQIMRYALSLGTVVMLGGCGKCDCLRDESMKNKNNMPSCCGGCESEVEKSVPVNADVSGTSEYVQTKSGLKYTILKQPKSGATCPRKGQAVAVHYTGWLDEKGQLGAKFDSSVDRGEPFVFKVGVGYVIPGWDEGVLGMRVGEKRRLVIPAHLGYGSRGMPPRIPGGATLIFDVELLEVENAQ